MSKDNKKIPPINWSVIENFPYIEEDFDAITTWQMLQQLGNKINEIITFMNTVLDQEISEYIDARFNEMIINSLYESETETLVLYLDNTGGDN